jgi:hypothetical protein
MIVQDLNRNNSNIKTGMITMVGQITTILIGEMRKNIKY